MDSSEIHIKKYARSVDIRPDPNLFGKTDPDLEPGPKLFAKSKNKFRINTTDLYTTLPTLYHKNDIGWVGSYIFSMGYL